MGDDVAQLEKDLEETMRIVKELEQKVDELEGELQQAKDEAGKYHEALGSIAFEAKAALK